MGKSATQAGTAALLTLLLAGTTLVARGDEPTRSAFPEGSSSVIEALTWDLIGANPANLQSQARDAARDISGAVIVKDEAHLLVVSLPSQSLPDLHTALSRLGTVHASKEQNHGAAATTLLQVRFVGPAVP